MDNPIFNGSTQAAHGATLDQRHGQAALLLVESLMHVLLEKGVISQEEFVETVEGAAEVEHELVKEKASTPGSRNSIVSLSFSPGFAFRK